MRLPVMMKLFIGDWITEVMIMIAGYDDFEPLKAIIPDFVLKILCSLNPKNKPTPVIDCRNRRNAEGRVV